jgi:hypothetical protein
MFEKLDNLLTETLINCKNQINFEIIDNIFYCLPNNYKIDIIKINRRFPNILFHNFNEIEEFNDDIISKKSNLLLIIDTLNHLSENAIIEKSNLIEIDIIIILDSKNTLIKEKSNFLHNKYTFWDQPTVQINKKNKSNYHYYFFKKKEFLELNTKRLVQSAATDGYFSDYNKSFFGKSLQQQLVCLKNEIYEASYLNKNLNILRFGDGDLYFMNALPVGSAKPGSRALSIEYQYKNNLNLIRKGIYKVDILTTEINSLASGGIYLSLFLEIFYKIFPSYHKSYFSKNWKINRWFYHIIRLSSKILIKPLPKFIFSPIIFTLRFFLKIKTSNFPILKPPKYNLETVYCLVSTRLIFKMFPSEIMIVGGKEKIEAIKILEEYTDYKNYIGISKFCGFVEVPKIGAADNEQLVIDDIIDSYNIYKPKIILLGIGSSKLYIMPILKSKINAIIIDIGAGIDALAGVISQDRPYFANWINYSSKKINYDQMDMMDLNNPARFSKKYRKIYLD